MHFHRAARFCCFCLLAVLAHGVSVPVPAQEVRPLPMDTVLRMARLGGGLRSLSPDGAWVAYSVARRNPATPRGRSDDAYLATGLVWNGLGSDIWIVNMKTHQAKNLTGSQGNSWSPCWSPDGSLLAFLSDRDGSGQTRLWVWSAREDRLRLVAEVPIRMPGPQPIEWTPDGRKVLVTAVPLGVGVPDFLKQTAPWIERETAKRESSGLTVRVHRWPLAPGEESAATTADALTSLYLIHDLVAIDVVTGQASTVVHGKKVVAFHVSRDGTKVVYTVQEGFEPSGSQQGRYDVWVVTLPSFEEKRIASGIRLDLNADVSLSPDGALVSFRANGYAEDRFDVYVVDATGMRPPRNLTHFEKQPSEGRWRKRLHWDFAPTILWDHQAKHVFFLQGGDLWSASPGDGTARQVCHIEGRRIRQILPSDTNLLGTIEDGRSALVMTRDETQKQDSFYRVPLGGGPAVKVLERGECYTCDAGVRGYLAVVSADGRTMVYTSQDAEHPADLWIDTAPFGNPSRLTELNPDFSRYRMGKSRLMDWLDDDGQRLQGVLTLPSNYKEGDRCPLVALVYGGDYLSDALERFGGYDRALPYLNIQILATRGYAVLEPDAPQHLGTPMLDLAKTILPGVSRAVELGIADPERIGVMGQSYGGYSALSLLIETNRFQAAVSTSGVANWIGIYGELDKDGAAYGTSLATGQSLLGGTPWEYRDRYIENSPIFYLDRVETPVLLISGFDDTTVAPFLSDEVFVGLRRLGKVVEYRKYYGEEHQVDGYENQLDLGNRIVSWFDQYLRGSECSGGLKQRNCR